MEFPLIQKFGKVSVSPPIDVEELPKCEKSLQMLRDALKIKGQLEICENKAKLLKDDTWCQGDEYNKLKEDLKQFDDETQKRIDAIKRDKVNWSNADEDGINVEEELDEEEIGMRLTKLKPDGGPRRDRDGNGRGRGGFDRDRRGRSQARPRRDNNDLDDERREQAPPRKQERKQEKFNGGNTEAFPTF
jgi:hypothetical protein